MSEPSTLVLAVVVLIVAVAGLIKNIKKVRSFCCSCDISSSTPRENKGDCDTCSLGTIATPRGKNQRKKSTPRGKNIRTKSESCINVDTKDVELCEKKKNGLMKKVMEQFTPRTQQNLEKAFGSPQPKVEIKLPEKISINIDDLEDAPL